jgi:hypothetical protein
VKLADLIGDLTGGTKYKRIYRLVCRDPLCSCLAIDRSTSFLKALGGAVSRSPTCEIWGTSSYGDSPWSNSTHALWRKESRRGVKWRLREIDKNSLTGYSEGVT